MVEFVSRCLSKLIGWPCETPAVVCNIGHTELAAVSVSGVQTVQIPPAK